MRSTPSPKSYRSIASQSPSNTSRVRFEDLEDTPAIDNPLFQPGNHFRPIKKQHSSPVHRQGLVSTTVVKPEPIHYTGLSENPVYSSTMPKQEYRKHRQHRQQQSNRFVNRDSSTDEGFGDSGNESGFILGTFPRSHSEERRYHHGSLFAKTVPWKQR